ncbi:MAG TPA: MFS transporter, partial [Vicinamibacterales bacterium]|nr:MFS transporter [Vicinamibacterales bacterium]
SLAALLGWTPKLIFGLAAGVLSDRVSRRRIVLIANGIRVIVVAALVSLLAADGLTIAMALMLLGALSVCEVFADNTLSTMTPMLVARDDLGLANARLGAGFITLNQLVGPPIGALLFAAGHSSPFIGQLLLEVAGILLIARVVSPDHEFERAQHTGAWQDVVEGLRWTLRHTAVRTLLLTILIFNVTFGAAWSVLVLYARERLGLGAVGFGLITTVGAVGGLLGTSTYGWLTERVSLGNIMRVGLVIETLTHLGLAMTRSVWIAAPVYFVFSAHAFIWNTTSVTVRQRAVPSSLQGRVASVNTMAVFGGLVIGSLVGGILARRFGVAAPFWYAFVGSTIFLTLLWRQLASIAHVEDPDASTHAPVAAG